MTQSVGCECCAEVDRLTRALEDAERDIEQRRHLAETLNADKQRLTRALTEATRERDEAREKYDLAMKAVEREIGRCDEANEKIARLTEGYMRPYAENLWRCAVCLSEVDRGKQARHYRKCPAWTEPFALTTTTEEKANG